MVGAGRVGRAHGLDGSFLVTRPETAVLEAADAFHVAGVLRPVTRRAGTPARPILRLEGVESREAAEALRGQDLLADDALLPGLEEGEFWASDLEGCRVVDGATEVGVVARMVALPSCEALEVGEWLIPLVRDAVRSVDVQARVIDVDMGFVRG
jgi:16S rRNA processing protein RimM